MAVKFNPFTGTFDFSFAQTEDTTHVLKAGDTMTGALTVPTIIGGIGTTSALTLQTTSGVGATGADMHFLVGNNGATEAVTILNSGNVGIGNTSPGAPLEVFSATNPQVKISYDATNNTTLTTENDGDFTIDPSGGFFRVLAATSLTNDLYMNEKPIYDVGNTGNDWTGTALTSAVPLRVTSASNSYFTGGGNVGIGITSPTAILNIKAGTATANTSPLKFNSGVLNTTAEAGAVEFLTDDYYATITTSAVRKTIAWIPSQTDVTASRALNTTYTAPTTRSIMVKAYIRCVVTLAGGNAYGVGKSDTATPPTTVVTGNVGIEAGLLGEDNTFEISFIVAPGKTYILTSVATNGTVTLEKWMEIAY